MEPWELASEERMMGVLEECRPSARIRMTGLEGDRGITKLRAAMLRRELGRWAGRRLTLSEQLSKARGELLCEPVYYGKRRDEGGK